MAIYLQEFFKNILRGIIMAFAVRRDAPSVALARFEYTLEDGRGRGEKKKNRSARAKTVIVQSSGLVMGEESKGFPRPLSLN